MLGRTDRKLLVGRWIAVCLAGLLLGPAALRAAAEQAPEQVDVFVRGQDGYHSYRIPALLVTPKGTVLAFCEGRKSAARDSGDIDLLVKHSDDGGRTWSRQALVRDDGPNTCGNPCPVVDHETGRVWLLMTHNLGVDHERQIIDQTSQGTRTVWVTSSSDDGQTWAAPKDITGTVKKPEWTWYATGPGVGIQMRHARHKGRLVIPCDHIEAGTNEYYSHVIYSDDHGQTWQVGGSSPTDQVNECQVIEQASGWLMLNMRNYDRNQKRRAVCRSGDGGQTWSGFRHDPALSEPICQASLIRYQPADAPGEPIVLFSNPASESKRVGLTVRLSYNDGGDWSVAKELHTGPAAYSCLATLPDGDVACLYEAGETEPYEKIRLTRFTLDWLTDRAHRLPSTVRPVPRSAQWWQQRHEQVNARARQGGVDLVFLGDSITQGWETAGKTVWEKYYGPRNAVNIGFSGDRTQHVLWRLDHGNVADLTPKTVVVMIGTNNSNGQDNTAAEIAAGITAIVEKLRAKLPQTKVLLLGVFPRGAQPNAQREKNATASHLAAQCADGEMIHYLDIGEAFLEPDKSLSREIMPDLLHLSPRGYEIWAEAIEEKLAELLGD